MLHVLFSDTRTVISSLDDGLRSSPTYNLGHIQDDNGRLESNAKTGNQTSSNEKTKAVGGNLQNDTGHIDEAANDDGKPATDQFCAVSSDDRTEEGTRGQDRDDQRLMRARERRCRRTFDDLNEHLGAVNAIDVA